MVPGTGMYQGIGFQWCQGQCINGCALYGVALGGFVSVIGDPRGDHPLTGFVEF